MPALNFETVTCSVSKIVAISTQLVVFPVAKVPFFAKEHAHVTDLLAQRHLFLFIYFEDQHRSIY